jgi:hypothetical protein
VNKPLKALIKKAYSEYRYEALRGKTVKDLVGSVLTVPRECLFDMIESAYETINNENRRRRWIAKAFAKCGQDPWIDDQTEFENHLASLDECSVYMHMKSALAQVNLQ